MARKEKFFTIVFPHDKGFKYDEIRYPAGEWQIRLKNLDDIKRAVEKADAIKLTAHISDGEVMRLLLLLDAIRYVFPAKPLILDLPYLPYSRADRRFTEGDCFGLRVFGRLLGTSGYDYVTTVDVHSDKAQRYVWCLKNFSPEKIIHEAIKKIGKKDLTVVIPDEGAVNRYDWYGFGVPFVQASKVRDPLTGKLLEFSCPPIKTQKVLIIDDICDGGGTFVGLAQKIRMQHTGTQSQRIYLYVTHGIFSKGLKELYTYFDDIFTADTFQKEKK